MKITNKLNKCAMQDCIITYKKISVMEKKKQLLHFENDITEIWKQRY
jgi:hypothetical protein